ncbi:MAG: (deoxy)nucleoside triphosphate pyrophosphohydrolase [Pseudomonadota bacterium]|nr:(deoxy)nucleoside triphosphate pyrophosphohydrolase [Pseudomonadota bacterium]
MTVLRVVAGVLVRDGRVLAAKRAPGTREAGLWEFPGGKLEPGEDDATALVRELAEELGVVVLAGELLGVNEHAYAHGVVRLAALRCTLVSGEPAALDHEALRWLGPHELESVDWAPADVPLLHAVRALLGA